MVETFSARARLVPLAIPYPVHINSRADLAGVIAKLSAAGAIGAPVLMGALYRGEICLQIVPPGGFVSITKAFIRAVGERPAVLLIPDDGGLDLGPAGFPGAVRAFAWGRWFLVHGAGAEAWHYKQAIEAAKHHRHVVVVECSSKTLPAWCAMTKAAPNRNGGMVLLPPPGSSHPARGLLQ